MEDKGGSTTEMNGDWNLVEKRKRGQRPEQESTFQAQGELRPIGLGPYQDAPYALILWYVSKTIYLSKD